MKLPSLMILSSAVLQIILGGTLGLGLGRFRNSACAASQRVR